MASDSNDTASSIAPLPRIKPARSVKLLAGADGKIPGGHILGANAGDPVAVVIYAMRWV